MATPHIDAEPGDIAPLVLMPGDPVGPRLVSRVRGIGTWTGTHDGVPMSVTASGMGIPSISIYATELYRFFGVQRICRVGTCGGISPDVLVRDVVIASCAHTSSGVATAFVPGVTLSMAADFGMLRAAAEAAEAKGLSAHVGPVYSTDFFYDDRPDLVPALTARGTLAIEMESAALYGIAAREGGKALTVLTVSDNLLDGSADLDAAERETVFQQSLEVSAAALLS